MIVTFHEIDSAEDAHRCTAVLAVLDERTRQNAKFPDQSHHASVWLSILGEEVGESNQAMLHTMFGGKAGGTLRAEMVQVAAVAMAIVEAIDSGRCWYERPIEQSQDNEAKPALRVQPTNVTPFGPSVGEEFTSHLVDSLTA